MDIGEIIEKGKTQKVLVICNTVLKSQEIYDCIENLKESINVYLLHSLYIKRDRRTLERMIKEFSEDNTSTGIWITTQIVEASLDIDFDMLYTEMCTADSLLQRMGRCNRKGRYIPQEANIIIYNNENGKEIIYDSIIYDRSLKYLNKYQNIIFTETMKRDYVNDVYCTEQIKDTEYYKKIEYWLSQLSCIRPMEYTKQQVNNIFREMGRSITVMPERIYEENREKIEKLIEMLKIDGLGKKLKWLIRNKLNELTMAINYYGHRPENINETTIGYDGKHDVTGIYLIKRIYEFDETGGGRGLVKN